MRSNLKIGDILDPQNKSDNNQNNISEETKIIHRTPEQLEVFVKENYELLVRMIKFAKINNLQIRPFRPNPAKPNQGTFACSLGESGQQYFDAYVRGKIPFDSIPKKFFKPKYIEYREPWLREKQKNVIAGIIDHELQHAESSNYEDIVINARKEIENNIPRGSALMFFNGANEDPYMGRHQISKGRGKKQGVKNLYQDMWMDDKIRETNTFDMRSRDTKLNQLSVKMCYERLRRDFPEDFPVDVIVDDDVQQNFEEILPYFDEMIDPNISNDQRIARKNEILWPIIQKLSVEDIKNQERQRAKEKLSQQQNQSNEEQNQGDESQDNKEGQESSEQGSSGEGSSEQEGQQEGQGQANNQENQESDNQSGSNQTTQDIQNQTKDSLDKNLQQTGEQNNQGGEQNNQPNESQPSQSSDKKGNTINSGEGQISDQEPTEQEVDDYMNSLSEEQKQELLQEAIKAIEEKNNESMSQDMPNIPWPIEQSDDMQQEPEYPHEQKDRELNDQEKQVQQEIDKVIKETEKRESDINKINELKKKIKELEKQSKDFKDFDKSQKEIDTLKKELEKKIKTSDLQKEAKKALEKIQKDIQDKRKAYEKKLNKQGFSSREEKYYKQYIDIEKKSSHQVEGFIRELSNYMPKINKYSISGNYQSGRIYNMLKSSLKLKMGHYHELYGRKESKESIKINLGICLSIDVSGSMKDNMPQVKELVVFLGLLCQKRNIPFDVNAFGEYLHIIKTVDEDYETKKGSVMRLADNLENSTDISAAVQYNLNTIKKEQFTNPEITFLPIFITDGAPNDGLTGDELIKETKKFNGLELVFGLGLDENEKSETKQNFPRSKPIFLDTANEMMTKGKQQLIQYLVRNKDKIFKGL